MFNTSRVKISLAFVSIFFVVGILVYSHFIVMELRQESKKILTIYTELYAQLASNDNFEDFSFIFDEIINKINFPIIITAGKQKDITAWKNIEGIENEERLNTELSKILESRVLEMDNYSKSVPLEYEDMVIGYIHYGDSKIITRLKWMPYIEILGAAILIFIGFLGFEYVRSSERKFIWVGLAKETAHQLGTPISSLLGWLELAKSKFDEPVNEFDEMEIDIQRLERVSHRFSQIGSKTKNKNIDMEKVFLDVKNYITQRIPQKNQFVEIVFDTSEYEATKIRGNEDLLEWALENLIKNAVDALEGRRGKIKISLKGDGKRTVIIDVKDNGKGIPEKYWKTVFRAGFSTKKRGWGLGLTLTKRIIEEMHKGKISVVHSVLNEGTIFRIILS